VVRCREPVPEAMLLGVAETGGSPLLEVTGRIEEGARAGHIATATLGAPCSGRRRVGRLDTVPGVVARAGLPMRRVEPATTSGEMFDGAPDPASCPHSASRSQARQRPAGAQSLVASLSVRGPCVTRRLHADRCAAAVASDRHSSRHTVPLGVERPIVGDFDATPL
jgi:hypothetical protein